MSAALGVGCVAEQHPASNAADMEGVVIEDGELRMKNDCYDEGEHNLHLNEKSHF